MSAVATSPIYDAELADLFAGFAQFDGLFLAVSGGVDSTALMHLAAGWHHSRGSNRPQLHVLTVNHGLRPEAEAEIETVIAAAAALGLPAEALRWSGLLPKTGIQEWARDVRYELLLSRAAKASGRIALVTAHHRDDLAETLLMHLARGSGVDGLAAMQPITVRGGITILRPLLNIPKARLSATLVTEGVQWSDDPSNENVEFERIRLRSAHTARDELGLDDGALALTAGRMARARTALDAATAGQLTPCLDKPLLVSCGLFEWRWQLATLPEEIAVRLLMRILPAVGGITQVRLRRVERLLEDMQSCSFAGATLGNCIVALADGTSERAFHIYREPGRGTLPDFSSSLTEPQIWDNRFEIRQRSGSAAAGPCRIRALKRDDLEAAGKLDALPCPLDALRSTPAIEDANGRIWLPALDVHGSAGVVAPLQCRFLVGGMKSAPACTRD